MKQLSLLIMLLFFFVACRDESPLESITECDFVADLETTDGLLDETEIAILNDCHASRLVDDEAIAANLIGEWELVGYGSGWFSGVKQPCGSMQITEDDLTFEYHSALEDSLAVFEWEIENGWLKVNPESELLTMHNFCDQYMIGDRGPFGVLIIDTDTYIYKKL